MTGRLEKEKTIKLKPNEDILMTGDTISFTTDVSDDVFVITAMRTISYKVDGRPYHGLVISSKKVTKQVKVIFK